MQENEKERQSVINKIPSKLMIFLKSLLAGFDDLIKMIVKEAIIRSLTEAYKKDPLATKAGVASFYPICDAYLETAVKKTETLYDDAVISGLMESMQDFSKSVDLILPNIDSD